MTLTPGKLIMAKDYPADDDARAYVAAVESADGQSLEPAVIAAYDNFIVGCKADGIWDAIKASCILAGARTLDGALVPLTGTAPTNFNFVAADYDRKTGLGDSSNTTKYLTSGLAYNAIPSNSEHLSLYKSTGGSGSQNFIGGGITSPVCVSRIANITGQARYDLQVNAASTYGGLNATGFVGCRRNNASNIDYRQSGTTANSTYSSQTRANVSTPYGVFCANYSDLGVLAISNARLSFYSIGESLDLALLDTRVSTLISDLGAAIP